MAVESAVHAALSGTFRYVLAEQRLTLLSGTEPVLTFEAEPVPTLEGGTWKITGFNNGRQAVVSPLSGTALSATFREGFVTGSAGCNTFRARYTVDADRIVVGPAAVTRRICSGDGVMQQEREFLSALQSATTWGFSGRLLDMHRADGERALTAAAD
jgi:heat shock protein HslJ